MTKSEGSFMIGAYTRRGETSWSTLSGSVGGCAAPNPRLKSRPFATISLMEARTENIIRTSFGTASKPVHASGGSWYKLPPTLPRPLIPTISPPKSTYCEKINPFLSVQFESLHLSSGMNGGTSGRFQIIMFQSLFFWIPLFREC